MRWGGIQILKRLRWVIENGCCESLAESTSFRNEIVEEGKIAKLGLLFKLRRHQVKNKWGVGTEGGGDEREWGWERFNDFTDLFNYVISRFLETLRGLDRLGAKDRWRGGGGWVTLFMNVA